MNHAQRGVAMSYLVWRNHARRHEIVNLIETYLLPPELLPDRIKSLDSALDANEGGVRLAHLFLDVGRHTTQELFVFGPTLLELRRQLAIVFRVQVLKREVLQFAAQLAHAYPVRNGGENVHRFLRNSFAFFCREVMQSAHVVKTVSKLDQHDANIVDHREQHLANVLSLLLFTRYVTDLRDLR